MRSLRTLSFLVVATLALAASAGAAGAQSVDDAKDEAAAAENRAAAASGLVDEAVAARSDIEFRLADTIARVNDLSAELSSVSAGLDRLAEQIAFADAELIDLSAAMEQQAINAYMTALGAPGVTFVNTENVEKALVAGLVVEDVVSAGKQKADELEYKKRSLEELQADFLQAEAEVAAVKEKVDAEMATLEALYGEADAAVAVAIREANAADAAYRSALSAVESAQAREAESRRQQHRDPPAPPTTTPASPETTPPPTTTPSPPPTEAGTGGGGGKIWSFPPVVEQWRGLVGRHFPSSRVDEALAIIDCESGGDPDAYNPYSGASGLFQFLPATWASTSAKAGYAGASVFDPDANVGTAAWLANRYHELGDSYWRPWSCRRVLG